MRWLVELAPKMGRYLTTVKPSHESNDFVVVLGLCCVLGMSVFATVDFIKARDGDSLTAKAPKHKSYEIVTRMQILKKFGYINPKGNHPKLDESIRVARLRREFQEKYRLPIKITVTIGER